MKQIIYHAVDWTSIKLNAVCILGFITGNPALSILAGIASVATIIYNAIRIYKEVKK